MPSIFRGSVTLHSALLLVALWGSKEIFFHQRSWEMKWTFNNLSPVRFGQLLFINRSDADSDCLVTFMSIHRTGKAEAVQDLSVNLPQFPEHNFSVYQREKNFTSMCVVCYITICCCKWMVWGSRQTVICHCLPHPPALPSVFLHRIPVPIQTSCLCLLICIIQTSPPSSAIYCLAPLPVTLFIGSKAQHSNGSKRNGKWSMEE